MEGKLVILHFFIVLIEKVASFISGEFGGSGLLLESGVCLFLDLMDESVHITSQSQRKGLWELNWIQCIIAY